MPDKDVNIKLKVSGAAEARDQIAKTGKTAQDTGETMGKAQTDTAKASEQTNEKLSKQGSIFSSLKTSVLGWIAGFAGLATVTKALDMLADKLQRISGLLKEIHGNHLSLQELGQSLELQTGTVGKQDFWSKQAGGIQKSGGLKSPEQASQILTALDINYGLDAGQNKKMLKLANDIAPMVGAADMSPAEIQQFITLGKSVGVEATKEAWEAFYAQTRAAFTKGDADNFGEYLEGLNTGTQGFLQSGASLKEVSEIYNEALSVTPNNTAQAATLTNTVMKLSSGGYKDARHSLEKFGKITWSDLTPKEQVDLITKFTNSVPANQRVQHLVEAGFDAGYANDLVKFAGPKAQEKGELTKQAVDSATAEDTRKLTDSYLETPLAESRKIDAEKNLRDIRVGKKYADWENELQRKKQELGERVVEGTDRFMVNDEIEPYLMIVEDLEKKIREGDTGSLSEDEIRDFGIDIWSLKNNLNDPLRGRFKADKANLEKQTRDLYQDYTGQQQQPQQQPSIMININTNDVINNFDQNNVETSRFSQDEF